MLRNIIRVEKLCAISKLKNIKLNQPTPYFARIEKKNLYTCTTVCQNTKQNPFAREPVDQSENVDDEKKLKILQLEVDVLRQEGHRVPALEFFDEQRWKQLLALNSRSARRKFYAYLWQIEKKKEGKAIKKELKQEEVAKRRAAEKLDVEAQNHIIYALNHTCFLLRIFDTTINHWNNNKLIRAIQFGQKLVFDCSYDEHMTRREAVNAAKQLMLCFANNRMHDDPFDLHFCNANFKGDTMTYLEKHIPTMHDASFPLNVHEKCFTELFPKERLVYLTPHCRNDLEQFNPDDIYIVGCMVDKINNEPLSLAKAKRLGLRMARLPLDKYLQWGAGSGKSLTLDQMINILLDVSVDNNWKNALRHVPRRKIIDYTKHQEIRRTEINSERYKFNLDTWAAPKRKPKA